MTDDVRPDVIKRTQDVLGKYFKKPPLTEKLLKKPPFRFLHDIISAIIRETGFLNGLFTEEELNSDNIKDKEAKLAFLTKLTDIMKLISGSNLTVRPSKIISGQEPTKTNELLQAIGKALDKKISSEEAIEHYKRNLEKKSKTVGKTKSSSKDTQRKASARHSSQTRKQTEKENVLSVQKRSSSTGKVPARENEMFNEHAEEKVPFSEKGTPEKDRVNKINHEIIDIPPAEPIQERRSSAVQKRRQSSSGTLKHRNQSSANLLDAAKDKPSSTNLSADTQNENHVQRKDSANTIRRNQNQENIELSDSTKNTLDALHNVESKSINNTQSEKIDANADVIVDNVSSSGEGTETRYQHSERSDNIVAESVKNQSDPVDIRPRTSLRPPTARPISARPAAPRMRAKAELIINEEIITPMGNINVIVENSETKEDDDAEDMVVMETKANIDSMEHNYKMDSQLTQEHGHLVAQILETQRELVNTDNVDVLPKKVDIAWEAGTKRDRETMMKEIDKLRSTIQTLTRTTNPLGKLFDYLQEDVEIMQKEFTDWRNQYTQLTEELKKEELQTQALIEPMKNTLKEIESNMKDQLNKICQAKAKIMKNDQKIHRLLNGHS